MYFRDLRQGTQCEVAAMTKRWQEPSPEAKNVKHCTTQIGRSRLLIIIETVQKSFSTSQIEIAVSSKVLSYDLGTGLMFAAHNMT